MDCRLLCWTFCLTIQELLIRHFQNSSDMSDVTDVFHEACIIHCTCSDSVIGKDFHVKRLCPVCKILSETALALGHLLYMDMSPSSKNVMGHIYTPQKMFLLAFSFANFETTRGSRGKVNIKVHYIAQKKLLLNFQNSQMKKRGETLFGECIVDVPNPTGHTSKPMGEVPFLWL